MVFIDLETVKSAAFFAILVGLLTTANCGNFQSQKPINLRSGQKAEVFYTIEESDQGVRILSAVFQNEKRVLKETELDRDAYDIWKGLEVEAEKFGIEEGILKYNFFAGEITKDKKRVFETVLYNAEKTENGRWLVKRAG